MHETSAVQGIMHAGLFRHIYILLTNDPLESFDFHASRVPANIFLQWIHASTGQLTQEVVCTEQNAEKSLTDFELEMYRV